MKRDTGSFKTQLIKRAVASVRMHTTPTGQADPIAYGRALQTVCPYGQPQVITSRSQTYGYKRWHDTT